MFPVLTTFRKATNSRKAMLSPTITTSVVPVAGCCSTLARAMLASFLSWPDSPSGDGCGRLFLFGRRLQVQFGSKLLDNLLEVLFKGVAIAVGRSADP